MITLFFLRFFSNFDADVRYQYVVDGQPIGRLLFRQFCEVSPKYQRYNHFLDLMDKYVSPCLLALVER